MLTFDEALRITIMSFPTGTTVLRTRPLRMVGISGRQDIGRLVIGIIDNLKSHGYEIDESHFSELTPAWRVSELASIVMSHALPGSEDFPEDLVPLPGSEDFPEGSASALSSTKDTDESESA